MSNTQNTMALGREALQLKRWSPHSRLTHVLIALLPFQCSDFPATRPLRLACRDCLLLLIKSPSHLALGTWHLESRTWLIHRDRCMDSSLLRSRSQPLPGLPSAVASPSVGSKFTPNTKCKGGRCCLSVPAWTPYRFSSLPVLQVSIQPRPWQFQQLTETVLLTSAPGKLDASREQRATILAPIPGFQHHRLPPQPRGCVRLKQSPMGVAPSPSGSHRHLTALPHSTKPSLSASIGPPPAPFSTLR